MRKRAKNKVYFNFLQRMLPKLVKKQISSLVEYFSQQHCGWAMFATEEALVSPRSAARRPYKVYPSRGKYYNKRARNQQTNR